MSVPIIGLTGGIGSGKSFVAECFAQHGIDIVDADVVAREVVGPGTEGLAKLVAYFGKDILDEQNTLDRAKLRKIVFISPEKTQWLNETLHPLIRDKMKQSLTQASSNYVLFVVPLLYENKLYEWCDRICVVDLPESQQLSRASARDNNSEEQIKHIMANQCSRNERLSIAHDVIDNSKNKIHTAKQVNLLHNVYKNLYHDLQNS